VSIAGILADGRLNSYHVEIITFLKSKKNALLHFCPQRVQFALFPETVGSHP
jgi:hypothetical protein